MKQKTEEREKEKKEREIEREHRDSFGRVQSNNNKPT